jgi:hypothetical protein
MSFMLESLDTLVKTLSDDAFTRTRAHILQQYPDRTDKWRAKTLKLLQCKGSYPYEYMTDWQRFAEPTLPPIEGFTSSLSGECKPESYGHAQLVWAHFDCKSMRQYHDIYLRTDVMLLADVFESFRARWHTRRIRSMPHTTQRCHQCHGMHC